MEQLEAFFQNNPYYFGYILIGLGLFFLYGTYRDWNWLLQGDGRVFNIAWISQTFGRKFARMLMALLAIIFIVTGLFWLYLYTIV